MSALEATLDELRNATAGMTAQELLRHLMTEIFPGKCAISSSLRARSVAVLKMAAEIDPTVRVIFCHAPYVYAESVEYRERVVRRLGLTDVRDPEPADDDNEFFEDIRTSVWGGGDIESTVGLDAALDGVACWISAAYHRPYPDTPPPRLTQEKRLIRVDAVHDWSQQQIYGYLARYDLPLHPRISTPTYHY